MKTIETYSGYYAAKFARESKKNPMDWVIRPIKNKKNKYELIKIIKGA